MKATMLVRNRGLTTLFTVLALLIGLLAGQPSDVEAALHSHKGKPIFDGQDGVSHPPAFILVQCYAVRETAIFNDELNGVVCVTELWEAIDRREGGDHSNDRMVELQRWRTKKRQCASELAPHLPLFGSYKWPGWNNLSDVGERTLWVGKQKVIFVTGASLIVLKVKGREDRFGEPYVRSLATKLIATLDKTPNTDDSLCP